MSAGAPTPLLESDEDDAYTQDSDQAINTTDDDDDSKNFAADAADRRNGFAENITSSIRNTDPRVLASNHNRGQAVFVSSMLRVDSIPSIDFSTHPFI